jgi:ABC-type phosphonate transport system ATPase subunit
LKTSRSRQKLRTESAVVADAFNDGPRQDVSARTDCVF